MYTFMKFNLRHNFKVYYLMVKKKIKNTKCKHGKPNIEQLE